MRASGSPYSAEDIVIACKGKLVRGDSQAVFSAISTDSRDICGGDLFVPISGTNFDGHDFIVPALEAGARGSLSDRDINRALPLNLTDTVLIQVQDTVQALSDLASAHRSKYPIPLIAVTGSSGKTTVKEMIACILRKRNLLASKGNLNNTIGLPMTVLNIGPDHSIAVVEAGINRFDEMEQLARAACPDVAVITTVGPVHLEGLGSIANVASEKFGLVRALRKNGTAVLPADNPYIAPLIDKCPGKVFTFGIECGDFSAWNLTVGETSRFELITPFGKCDMELQLRGRHNCENALAACAAACAAGVAVEEAAASLKNFTPPSWRMEILRLPGERRLIKDCYNANPQSMKAALEVLTSEGNGMGTLAILGDMLELGPQSEHFHHKLGRSAAELAVSQCVFIGKFAQNFADGFIKAGGDLLKILTSKDKEEAWTEIRPRLNEYKAILVKGSRGMKMEILADRIIEEN